VLSDVVDYKTCNRYFPALGAHAQQILIDDDLLLTEEGSSVRDQMFGLIKEAQQTYHCIKNWMQRLSRM
jgi:hypothetical protein